MGDAIQTDPPSEPLTAPEFPNFSVRELIAQGKLLLASSGKEFVKPTGILATSQEVKKAKKDAMSRLGLEFLEDEMDLEKEFAAEMDVEQGNPGEAPNGDLVAPPSTGDAALPSPMDVCPPEFPCTKEKDTSPSTRSVTPNLPSPSTPNVPSVEVDTSALSARERNRLKRKRKPGNSAFVAPPPQTAGSRYAATASGTSNK